MTGRPILTAAEMRAAEAAVIAGGTSALILMERAGSAAAEAIRRFAGTMPTLILCGPGNNGGDGYVIARLLSGQGMDVRVAATGEPASDAARAARAGWTGEVEPIEQARPAPLLIDALFGTGLTRPLDDALWDRLASLAEAARERVAIDLPSGVATDDGRILSPVPDYDLTIGFQALKLSHLLQPAARHMGRIVIADIGVPAQSMLSEIARPKLAPPGPDDHKYKRGYVAVLGGEMQGASALAAAAALRAEAGYVRLVADAPVAGLPQAVVLGGDARLLAGDERINVIGAGPGLGRSPEAKALLDGVMAIDRPKVLDADALYLLGESPRDLSGCILTPHEGEFARLFPALAGSKVEKARSAAAATGAVIVLKGADTIVAGPSGCAAIAPPAPSWLATAGTGDVLTGIIAAMRARGLDPFEAACAGVWLHGRAAGIAGPGLIADDLVSSLPQALALR